MGLRIIARAVMGLTGNLNMVRPARHLSRSNIGASKIPHPLTVRRRGETNIKQNHQSFTSSRSQRRLFGLFSAKKIIPHHHEATLYEVRSPLARDDPVCLSRLVFRQYKAHDSGERVRRRLQPCDEDRPTSTSGSPQSPDHKSKEFSNPATLEQEYARGRHCRYGIAVAILRRNDGTL